jgi:hypothetical protein
MTGRRTFFSTELRRFIGRHYYQEISLPKAADV